MRDPMYQNKRPQWTDLNIDEGNTKSADGFTAPSAYYKRYYSVIDAEIYFGNQYVEDVASIQWSVQQNNFPLFGYNSYTYDEMAEGSRIIYGSFAINFTTPKYLYKILEEAKKEVNASVVQIKDYSVKRLSNEKKPWIKKGLYGEMYGTNDYPKWNQTFDIDVIFGQKTVVGNPVHIVLEGVVLGSCQMVLSGSAAGTPPNVMEQYSFVARNIRTYADSEEVSPDIKSHSKAANNSASSDTKQSSQQQTKKDTTNNQAASSKDSSQADKNLQEAIAKMSDDAKTELAAALTKK